MEREKFDLALLDIMLPGINGYELMDYAKACELPVIFLTALGSTEHKVKGLRMGADDYLPKPFEIVELLARVEAVLRRYHKTETMIQVNNVTIDTASHRVTLDGEEIYLTPKEFDLLLLFARNKNRALYRETIYAVSYTHLHCRLRSDGSDAVSGHSPHRPECHGVFQPLYQDQDTDGAGILQRILPPAERSGRK